MKIADAFTEFSPIDAGEPRVVCPDETVEAFQGDDVLLPCYTEFKIDPLNCMLMWDKRDTEDVVYTCLNQKDDPQMDKYRDRMKVDPGGLPRGNLSLSINSVRDSDSGLYDCFIPEYKTSCPVQLNVVNRTIEVFSTARPSTRDPDETIKGIDAVTPSGDAGMAIIATPIVIIFLFILGVFGWRKCQKKKSTSFTSIRELEEQLGGGAGVWH